MLDQSDFARIYAIVNEREPELATRFFDAFRSVEQEREACAQLAVDPDLLKPSEVPEETYWHLESYAQAVRQSIASAIRARK